MSPAANVASASASSVSRRSRGGRLGAERDRLERVGVVARGLGVAERRRRLARRLERRVPGRLRIGADRGRRRARGGRSAPRRRRRRRRGGRAARRATASCSARAARTGQRLADGVAHDRVREREVPGRVGVGDDHAAPTRRARPPPPPPTRGTPEARTRSAIVKRPATAPASSTGAVSGPSRSTRAAHDLAHAHGTRPSSRRPRQQPRRARRRRTGCRRCGRGPSRASSAGSSAGISARTASGVEPGQLDRLGARPRAGAATEHAISSRAPGSASTT